MVVSLMLELRRLEVRTDLSPEKLDSIALVSVAAQPHPDKMNMVRHQAASRTKQSFARRRVKHQLTKRGVKAIDQPALPAMENRHGPEDDGVSLVKFTLQPRQVVGKIRTEFSYGSVGSIEKFKAHGGILARTNVHGYPILRSRRRQPAQTPHKLMTIRAKREERKFGAD